MNETVSIITDHDGRKIVLINDVRFKSRRISCAIGELIEIASAKKEYPNYNDKHKKRAKFGWYRYDTRFGLPVYNENGELLQYNIFSVRMLVRCDEDGKLYLYDFVRTKKETSKPLE